MPVITPTYIGGPFSNVSEWDNDGETPFTNGKCGIGTAPIGDNVNNTLSNSKGFTNNGDTKASLGFWFKADAVQDNLDPMIVQIDRSSSNAPKAFECSMTTEGKIQVAFFSGVSANRVVSRSLLIYIDDVWRWCSVTVNGNDCNIHINGSEVSYSIENFTAGTAFATNGFSYSGSLKLSALGQTPDATDGFQFFKGEVEDLKLWQNITIDHAAEYALALLCGNLPPRSNFSGRVIESIYE